MDRGRIASASPPSPASRMVGAVTMPPVASCGMVGMLKPRGWPPTPGTQSGIVTEIPLIFSSTKLMAEITAFMGAFARLTIMPNRFPKISTTFCQAPDQLPVKTFCTKSIIPLKMAFMFSMAAEMLAAQPENRAPRNGNFSCRNAATELMAACTPLASIFMGASALATTVLKIAPKMLTMFCQAPDQFPANTFWTNWMAFWRITWILDHTF